MSTMQTGQIISVKHISSPNNGAGSAVISKSESIESASSTRHLETCWVEPVTVVVAWWLDLQLPMQSISITPNVVSSNPAHGEVYSMKHYVIKFVSDFRSMVSPLVFRFPPPIPPRHNWNIVKHHSHNPGKTVASSQLFKRLNKNKTSQNANSIRTMHTGYNRRSKIKTIKVQCN